jgi:hypothetical protein
MRDIDICSVRPQEMLYSLCLDPIATGPCLSGRNHA